MRALFLALLIGFPALALALVGYATIALRRFAAATPRIATPADLARFKRVAARQMVLALVQIGLLGAPLLLYAAGGITGHIALRGDVGYLLVPSLLVLGAGLLAKRVERRVHQLPASAELQHERDRVVQVWLTRPLPDW